MRSNRKFRIFLAATAVLMFWALTSAVVISRSQDGTNDFDTFYASGRAVLTHTGIYDGGEPGLSPFLYPPATACFFSLFALFPMPFAAFLWNTFLLAAFAGAFLLALRFLRISFDDFPALWRTALKGDTLLFLTIAFVMLLDGLAMAQVSVLIFFLCMLALVLWGRRRNFTAGLILSTAIFLKITPVFFCFYFVMKRAWRLLAGVLAGSLVLSLLIPVLVFGWETNRIYHRQWAGRMLKPALMDYVSDAVRKTQLEWTLTESNQSLESAVMRFFLKDRRFLVTPTGTYPLSIAARYDRLPLAGGGIPREALSAGIRSIQMILLLLAVWIWRRPDLKQRDSFRQPLEVSLVFLTMTLLSPITRSHYFIVWVFGYLTLLFMKAKGSELSKAPFLFPAARLSCIFYLLLAVPYGEAAGMGAWANLVFWLGCAGALIDKKI